MLENFLEPVCFYNSITSYLRKYSFSNAQTEDLFGIFQLGTIEFNLTDIMDTWTRQEGFPVVNVLKSKNKSENKSTYILTQKRFLADPDSKYDPSKSKYG